MLSPPFSVTPLPECSVANQLLDAIKAKENQERLSSILDTLSSALPDLENDRDSQSILLI